MTYVEPGSDPTVVASYSPPIAAASGSSAQTTEPRLAPARKSANAPRSTSKVP